MAKRGEMEHIAEAESVVMVTAAAAAAATPAKVVVREEDAHHPYAFHVSGPRNVASPNWRDLVNSSWKNPNYKRTVMACFIQAAYLLELDRQEKRKKHNALAPKWWIPFKYKLSQTLVDERDGSIFGAVLEWDRAAAMADLVLIRPTGAPRGVLALRGTLLKTPTIRRDIEDDLRFLTRESLKGSARFKVALEALRSVTQRYGSSNICIAGHSLGAGFALQVGKAMAKEGLFVDAHLFNPPSISLAMSLRNIGERAGDAWKRFRSMLPGGNEPLVDNADEGTSSSSENISGLRKGEKASEEVKKWLPHLYVNDGDYVCCYYTDREAGKIFVVSKGKQKFLEAHRLEQWWSEDLEIQSAIHNSRLISQQLKSLYH
ncbi:PREDICTED: GDSL esterase/lipase At4g10955-like [Tarenaya hassleriana]|uniref:GDSL esterase/lipase At4g10955-like n=1 Tax=Tarenaya hassleriana TaxID=28532 RepID=UPI00053C6E8B|nr:PREDICTED: GDSL esterase/lipase At4g10955-like [Tarenaya hassleriana]